MSIKAAIESKLRIFLVITLLITLIGSCRKSDLNVIPYVMVDFTIDLLDAEFTDLNAVANFVLVDETTNNWGIYSSGYDDNGIIVYRAQLDEFFAFDRTCPYEYSLNGTSIAVEIGPGEIFAVCPECGSMYALPSFGTPSEGPSRYPLKSYRTSFSNGRYIHVYN